MSVIKYTALLIVLLASVIAAQDCRVSVHQQQRSSWSANGNTYTLFDVSIRNDGASDVSTIEFTVSPAFDSSWEIASARDNKYTLPEYRTISSGASHNFGYIVKSSSPVKFTIVSCGGDDVAAPTSAPTQKATSAPATKAPATEKPTKAPVTEKPTKAPTTKPTKAPATEKPTKAPTTKPTKAPTVAPTQKPTKAPTTKPTKAATTAPTKAATTKPTAAATTKPTPTASATNAPSNGDKICPTGTWWQPAPLTTWQWVISTTPDTSLDVQMYDIDLFSSTPATIKKLHDAGRAVICYFSTQYENWRPDASSFPSAALGKNLDDWAGERWVDTRNAGIRSVMKARLDLAVSKGCDGVEPDNVDGYKASSGFPLTAATQLEYNKFLAAEAHARGLSIGLKNDLSQVAELVNNFDWALNEECYQYGECDRIKPFIAANKAVFSCEYSGSGSTICPYMNNLKFSGLIKEHLDNTIKAQCCTYQSGGCATKASYRCVSQ